LATSPEFADIESLIALLVETGVLPPVTMAELGLNREASVLPSQQPAPFRGVLLTLCDLLEIREPAVLRHPGWWVMHVWPTCSRPHFCAARRFWSSPTR